MNVETLVAVLLGSGIVAATPLLLAALGETFAERAGLLNLGLEGMLLIGAFGGFVVALETDSILLGLSSGLLLGLLSGLIFGFLTISLAVDQIVVGLGLTLFASGLTGFLFRDLFGRRFPTLAVRSPRLALPLLSDLPVVGPALFDHHPMVYLSWLLVILSAFILSRTRFGLEIRATGESPLAADAAGVNIFHIRYIAIAIGGSLAGLGGAFLSVIDLNFFTPGMTVGQGFIAIAIAMLGRWSPYRVFIGALLFGLLKSLTNGLQVVGVDIQPEFVLMLPYLGIILALVVLAGRTSLPTALGVPYERGRK